ncbi:protein ALP1-like [Gigantopelta aegis]|uniref:protein ALP1-like n=1 Tax=Gigantopelta aegis TaxID=1735272 RepID=UPI001B88DBE0|nr:protein ALP1-like [Gigantopelta aegis]
MLSEEDTLFPPDNRAKLLQQCAMELLVLTAEAAMVIIIMRRQKEAEIVAARERRRMKRQRRVWVKQWLLRRVRFGQYEQLMVELGAEDQSSFKNVLRMEPDILREILQCVSHRIQKKDTFFRKALEPGLKLAITLRYLATGNSYKSLQYSFRVAHNTICKFIPEICQAIINEYTAEVMICPTTPEAWKEVAKGFKTAWNFPHCVGAIDGKHIAIRKPIQGVSYYYNYKGFFSTVLLAVVDADYKFLYVDIGANGAGSGAGIFNDTDLKRALEDGRIGLPPPEPLPNDNQPIGYFLVGDDAFALKPWMMKPLPPRNMTVGQRIYNYRLSRVRRVVENA